MTKIIDFYFSGCNGHDFNDIWTLRHTDHETFSDLLTFNVTNRFSGMGITYRIDRQGCAPQKKVLRYSRDVFSTRDFAVIETSIQAHIGRCNNLANAIDGDEIVKNTEFERLMAQFFRSSTPSFAERITNRKGTASRNQP